MQQEEIERRLQQELAAPLPPDELAEVVDGVRYLEELARQIRGLDLDSLEPALPLSLEEPQ